MGYSMGASGAICTILGICVSGFSLREVAKRSEDKEETRRLLFCFDYNQFYSRPNEGCILFWGGGANDMLGKKYDQ